MNERKAPQGDWVLESSSTRPRAAKSVASRERALDANARSRDATDFAALGRVELDSRTQSPWGALRSFIRVDAFYGSNGSAALGSLGQQLNTFNTTAGTSASRVTTVPNKAFIQFAGLTAGYAQSMFDFYADAYNYHSLRGSNATVALLAYTATFGNGFSATLSFEDQP